MPKVKTLSVVSSSQAKAKVKDVKTFGNPDLFQCLSKAWSETEGWMKSTKAMEIVDVGCVVQVTTQQGEQISDAVCFVPNVYIDEDDNGNKCLKKML